MQVQVLNLRKCLWQESALSFFRQSEFLLELLSLLDAFDHLHAFQNISCLDGQFIEDLLVQTRQ